MKVLSLKMQDKQINFFARIVYKSKGKIFETLKFIPDRGTLFLFTIEEDVEIDPQPLTVSEISTVYNSIISLNPILS